MLVFSCKTKEICHEKEYNTGIIESNFDMGKCFYFLDSSSYVINTIKDYQDLVNQTDSAYIANSMSDCLGYELYSIDFKDFTLLANYADGNGCSVAFQRDVINDSINKKYIFTVHVFECGDCNLTEVSMNWVKVPKLPDGYSVEFNVIKN